MGRLNLNYSYLIGLYKTLKTGIVIFLPAFLAFLANVPVEYTPIASLVAYYLKNMYEVRTSKKHV